MYLHLLSKPEQELFLELAHHAMFTDKKVSVDEKEIFDTYVHECQLFEYTLQHKEDLDYVLNELAKSKKMAKKLILVELLGVVLADDEYNELEKEFIEKTANAFGVNDYELSRLQRWVEDFNDIVERGFELVNK
jgi:uncharacterized tellurite resistance protein B-like protein